MLVLIWVSLIFSLRGHNADTGASVVGSGSSEKGFCITVSKAEVTAEAGLCVVLPCSFTPGPGFTAKHIAWYKCEPSEQKCGYSDVIFHTNNTNSKKVQSLFKRRVTLMEPDVSQGDCSIIINDLTESDSGSYQLRVDGLLNEKQDGYTFPQRATVSVKDLTQKPTVMIPPLTDGQQTTLTCTAPGLCSGSDPRITWMWRGTGEEDCHLTGNITAFKTENLTDVTQRHSSTLTFNSSAKHHGTNVTCKVSFTGNITTEGTVILNVTYLKKPVITGMTTIKEGDDLNLTCSVEGVGPSVITWTKLGFNKNLEKETTISLQNDTGTATLVIRNVTADHSGQYICTAKHQISSLTAHAEVIVKLFPRILSSSACVVKSEFLTCVCITEGVPLPIIKWPMLEKHTEYSLTTTVEKHTVKINITLAVKDRNYTSISCVSSNNIGEAKENLTIVLELKQEDVLKNLLITVKQPQVIIAFSIGIVLAATICCLARKCQRKKQKISGYVEETLEMVTTTVPLIAAGQAVENDVIHDQDAAERGAEVAEQSAGAGGNVEPMEVEYSNVDFSALKSKCPKEDSKETTETEYAEIKGEKTEKGTDHSEEEGELLEGNNEEEVIGQDNDEMKHCVPEEEERADVAVYSNVKEMMAEI